MGIELTLFPQRGPTLLGNHEAFHKISARIQTDCFPGAGAGMEQRIPLLQNLEILRDSAYEASKHTGLRYPKCILNNDSNGRPGTTTDH